MHAICPSIWVKCLNKIGNLIQKKNASEAGLHSRMYCIFPPIVVFFCKDAVPYVRKTLSLGSFWRSSGIILKKLSLSIKEGHKMKMRGRLSSMEDIFHLSTCTFLQEMYVLYKGLSSLQGRLQPVCTIFLQQQSFCWKECCNEHQPLHMFTAMLNTDHTLPISICICIHIYIYIYTSRIGISCFLREILYDWTKAEESPEGKLHFFRKEQCMFGGMLFML